MKTMTPSRAVIALLTVLTTSCTPPGTSPSPATRPLSIAPTPSGLPSQDSRPPSLNPSDPLPTIPPESPTLTQSPAPQASSSSGTGGGSAGGGGGGGLVTPPVFHALETVPDTLSVKTDDLASLQADLPALTFSRYDPSLGSVVVTGDRYQNLVNALASNAHVERMEPITVASLPTPPVTETLTILSVPTDPAYNDPRQFQAGGPNFTTRYPWQITQFESAWDTTLGSSSVIVAVIDTGVDTGHPEFTGRIVTGYDFVNNDADASDDHGHGTHVAGIVAAAMNNALGMVGGASNCRIMPIKVLAAAGGGSSDAIARGIVYAVNNGAKVINLSLGGMSPMPEVLDAVNYARTNNVSVLAAMGNDGQEVIAYPAGYSGNGLLAVGATDSVDQLASFSNRGSHISVSAPGYFILNTVMRGTGGALFGADYDFKSGTSMATPLVSALAGLIRSQYPTLTSLQVKNVIQDSSQDLGSAGFDKSFGWGRVKARAALDLAAGSVPTPNSPPAGNIQQFGLAYQGHTIRLTAAVTDADAGDTLTYQWQVDKGTLSGTTGSPVYLKIPKDSGNIQVLLTVSDGTNTLNLTRIIPIVTTGASVNANGGYF